MLNFLQLVISLFFFGFVILFGAFAASLAMSLAVILTLAMISGFSLFAAANVFWQMLMMIRGEYQRKPKKIMTIGLVIGFFSLLLLLMVM